jgi:hypothetical protein
MVNEIIGNTNLNIFLSFFCRQRARGKDGENGDDPVSHFVRQREAFEFKKSPKLQIILKKYTKTSASRSPTSALVC